MSMQNYVLFDRPIKSYMADDIALKWLGLAVKRQHIALDAAQQSALVLDRKALSEVIASTFQSWDPNGGQDHDKAIREELERKLESLSKTSMSRLTDDLRDAVLAEQKEGMGYGFIFVAPSSLLSLDEIQRRQLNELTLSADQLAAIATLKDMESIQIRNPQAFFAYKLFKLVEEKRKQRALLGQEFYESLATRQREMLQLGSPHTA